MPSSFYDEYLKSEEWAEFRKDALVAAGYRCRRCGFAGELDVHHKHYTTLGHESLSDVEVLCRDCHAVADAERKSSAVGPHYTPNSDAIHQVGIKVLKVRRKKIKRYEGTSLSPKALADSYGTPKARLRDEPDRVVKRLAKSGSKKAIMELQRRLKRGRQIGL
jgi:hypothetical protein